MHLTVRHATSYHYDRPPDRCALRLRLYPPSFETQRVSNWAVTVNGSAVPPLLTTASGDKESVWTCSGGDAQVEIIAEGEVETKDAAGVIRGLRDTVRAGVYMRASTMTLADKGIEKLAAGVPAGPGLERMHALCTAVRDAIEYRSGATTSQTTAAQALKQGAGVCQDHAHVFIAAARTLNVPARYIVGYLLAVDTVLTETHAWAEAHLPDIGWGGFDPANGICPTDRYVRLGCGLDSADAAPIRGSVVGAPQERLSASVDISQTQGQNQGQQ
jgi:transglutaminase-like putative cysteine protease